MPKASALRLAILGLLHDGPLHGYELRKRMTALLGAFRAISYGALYPALKTLADEGLISQTEETDRSARGASKRARITYTLTKTGQQHLAELLAESGPDNWEDEGFGVRFAFFNETESAVRRRIMEGRRARLAERRERMRKAMETTREKIDRYTLEMQRHGLDGIERELRWIDALIAAEEKPRKVR